MSLEQIIHEGTQTKWRESAETVQQWMAREKLKPSNHLKCADGFEVSVIAGWGAYCAPRPIGYGNAAAAADFEGPYTHVEVGFPSVRPEPWSEWEGYCESPTDPTGTVYSHVPVDTVRALITLHGGEA